MPKFKLFLNGSNLLMMDDDGMPTRYGFYQTHWIEADLFAVAKRIAVARALETPGLSEALLNKADDPPRIVVEEVEELDSFDEVDANPSGLALYPESSGDSLSVSSKPAT